MSCKNVKGASLKNISTLFVSHKGKETGCVALRTGNAAGLWDVQNCEVKAKFLCKKLAEKVTVPVASETISDSKCPLGWDTSNSTNSCFRVSIVFCHNPTHETGEH